MIDPAIMVGAVVRYAERHPSEYPLINQDIRHAASYHEFVVSESERAEMLLYPDALEQMMSEDVSRFGSRDVEPNRVHGPGR